MSTLRFTKHGVWHKTYFLGWWSYRHEEYIGHRIDFHVGRLALSIAWRPQA